MKIEIRNKTYDVELVTDYEQAKAVIKHSATADYIGIDIETAPKEKFVWHGKAGLEPNLSEIKTIQLYPYPESVVYVLHLSAIKVSDPLDERVKIPLDKFPEALKNLLMPLKDCALYAHNAKFEYQHFAHIGFKPTDLNCSMLLFLLLIHAIDAPLESSNKKRMSASLKSLAKVSCNYDLDKDIREGSWDVEELSPEQIKYAATDAVFTVLGSIWVLNKMAKQGLLDLLRFYNVNKEALPAIAEMSNNGLYLDRSRHDKKIKTWEKELAAREKALYKIIPEGLNLRSSKQVSDWIIEKLKELPKGDVILKEWQRSEKTKNLKTDSTNLALHSYLPFVDDLLKFKEASKLYSTYGPGLQKCVNPVSQRIHPGYTQCWTGTGRMSCVNPNIQQQPRGSFRDMYMPQKDGWVYVSADFSQIEVRVAAYHSGDKAMIRAFEHGDDLYIKLANNVLGRKITKKDPERQFFKAVLLGSLYGLGPDTMLNYLINMGIEGKTREDCETAIYGFRETYPQYRQWQFKVSEAAEVEYMSTTKMGKIRKLPADNFYCKSMNHPIQSDAAAIMLRSLRNVKKLLDELWMEAFTVMAVHDEITIEAPKDEAEKCEEILVVAMQEAMHYVFPQATLNGLIEPKTGLNWAECK